MTLPTCDRLPLPNELISLVKSFTWHELEAKRRKYEVLLQLKEAKHESGYSYSVIPYSCYEHPNIYLNYHFCECGNYIKFILYTKVPQRAICYCV